MAAMDVLAETESLCPQCLAKIAAQIEIRAITKG